MKKFKPLLILLIIIVVGVVGVYFVIAQTVSDTYDNDNKISAVWNISTSTSGQIKLASKTCDALDWFCSASTTCINHAGDGDYIIVAQANASGQKQWKTANTACDKPECGADDGQNGDDLVNDNTVDFTDYPARDYCKSIGARLPTRSELSCMWTYRATFGNNFESGHYWSSTETSDMNAWTRSFVTDSENLNNKTTSYYVRCVFGW